MTKRNENRPGYKKTKVGWIPEEWGCVRIQDVAKVITVSTPSTKKSEYYGNKFLFVGPADLDNGKYVFDSAKKLSNDGFGVCRKIPVGSTLFTCIGSTIGKVAIAGKVLATNQQINAVFPRIRIQKNSFTMLFLNYLPE
ncbi:restriction endonuclease subunit S [bacterium]|nr:restriction endonuclease subunit S [bacterium]